VAIDREREERDPQARQKSEEYRNAIRREGFHLVLKDVIRYRDAVGDLVVKANADVDLTVDMLTQSPNLDYVLLGSGDGDFVRLVRAIQNTGKRIDVFSFGNISRNLRQEADHYFSGFLVPGLFPEGEAGRLRGVMHGVNEEKGYGFISLMTGFEVDAQRNDIFLHISDYRTAAGESVGNAWFARLKTEETIIEFDLVEHEDGRSQAVNACEFRYTRDSGGYARPQVQEE
jgi:cold shock CspA family protein